MDLCRRDRKREEGQRRKAMGIPHIYFTQTTRDGTRTIAHAAPFDATEEEHAPNKY
jgi:hypothetical protein